MRTFCGLVADCETIQKPAFHKLTKEDTMPEKLLTIEEAAEQLRESATLVYRLCRLGQLPGAYKIGTGGPTSPWRIPESALAKYQEQQR